MENSKIHIINTLNSYNNNTFLVLALFSKHKNILLWKKKESINTYYKEYYLIPAWFFSLIKTIQINLSNMKFPVGSSQNKKRRLTQFPMTIKKGFPSIWTHVLLHLVPSWRHRSPPSNHERRCFEKEYRLL